MSFVVAAAVVYHFADCAVVFKDTTFTASTAVTDIRQFPLGCSFVVLFSVSAHG